jgi:hypothetical protein
MRTYDIKSMMPSSIEAKTKLINIINNSINKEKVIKIIHGYGSTGVGGKIKEITHQYLKQLINQNKIKAFIPGEAFSIPIGYDEVIHQFKLLIQNDEDYKKSNDGITYIIF